ncbi:MAG: hypothetical protein ACTSV6_07370 [Candidatus Heimdallarchaeota archaeon]
MSCKATWRSLYSNNSTTYNICQNKCNKTLSPAYCLSKYVENQLPQLQNDNSTKILRLVNGQNTRESIE